ncbi:cytochrome p450 [Diplodia corticola]|uniref:Cytochrome p450 n=1 Tax=Diplodia corticola TaxID=236234 RepID=A0A1J9R4Q0_9PEZI|nr:cytochrome p450 [Diplodia corticola]OJD36446.1 cytochrome p450 [Diplodia corticola]
MIGALMETDEKEITMHFLAWPILSSAVLLFCSWLFTPPPDTKSTPRAGPAPGWFGLARAKRNFLANGGKIIQSGYDKYKDSMFKVQTADMERIVLSNKYVDEIRTAPESVLSVRAGMTERHLGKYSTLDIILTSHLQNDVCKVQLTQNLNKLVGPVNEEACFWLSKTIPEAKGEVSLKGYESILRTVAGVTSRVLVGLPVSRSEEWLNTATGYTLDVFHVSTGLRAYPPFIRPFVAPFLSSTARVKRHIRTAEKCLVPLFEKRLQSSGEDKSLDMVQWLTDSARGSDRDAKVLTRKMLFLTLAAVHTSTMSATHALFDLCAMPQYIEPLRDEIREVVGKEGWTLSAINNMKRLDSFMKESQRVNHPGLLSFNRKVMSPLRLSDGTVIPAKSFITMATNSIAQDERYYMNPDSFDGFRFFRKRMQSEDEAKRHQFTSTGATSLPFGHGKFACPGRFFAAAQIKAVLANILLKYDVSFPAGQTERPENVFSGEGIGPSREQAVVFRPRRETTAAKAS